MSELGLVMSRFELVMARGKKRNGDVKWCQEDDWWFQEEDC